ncbi:MAG: hypothetical protein R2799_02460 [Crocinitomicaceae bacterium]
MIALLCFLALGFFGAKFTRGLGQEYSKSYKKETDLFRNNYF